MIELIFVIVILGILAAVAIPKLAATRTDAEVSKASSDLATVVSDMGAYYTAHGKFGKLGEMTNVTSFKSGDLNASAGTAANFQAGDEDCVLFTFNSVNDGNVTLSKVGSPSTAACKGLQSAATDLIKNHVFGGTGVTY
jgi:type II secretory pathway pseudopilin PulG